MSSHPSTILPSMEGSLSLTFAEVEERLVEAVLLWRRSPDRERGWLWVKAYWPDHRREHGAGDYDARGYLGTSSDVPLRPRPLNMAEVAERDRVSEWIGRYVPARDRELVALALGWKASGREVPWSRLLRQMGLTLGRHGLMRRYERAITAVVRGLERDGRRADA